jgi:glycosyltransferase involved in cell wall biosynthesis
LLKPVFCDFKKTELFNKYDFLVLPSKNENFGMVILESLARGLPVLTTTDTPWNIIKINDAGWVINLKQSNLTMCLKNIFKLDVKEFEEKSINAINLARNYQTENIYGEYIKTYEKLLGKK